MTRPKRISRYPIIRELGRGGMGEIYLGRDPDLEREIALKVLPRETDDPTALEQLRDEARAAAALRHPNIVTVYEVGDDEGRGFIAMEFIDGVSVRERMHEGSIDTTALLAIGADVARALAAAHRADVLHRDIKPDNVMIDGSGVVKVVDFGIAHRLDRVHPTADTVPVAPSKLLVEAIAATVPRELESAETAAAGVENAKTAAASLGTQTIFGTPGYMSPEILTGARATAAADVYALGVVLYEGFAGHLPYRGETVIEVLTKVADPEIAPEPLAGARPDLAPAINDLVEQMLAHDPADRPSAADVATRLDALAHPPTDEIRPLPRRALTSTLRRRRMRRVFWLSAMAVAAAMAALITWQLASRRSSRSVPPRDKPGLVAFAPIEGVLTGFFDAPPSGGVIALVSSRVLDSFGGFTAIYVDGKDREAEIELAVERGAETLVTGALVSAEPNAIEARLVILSLPEGTPRDELVIKADDIYGLVSSVAREVARALAPESVDRETATMSTAALGVELGFAALENQNGPLASIFFEQATRADPDAWDAWFYLAWARGWAGAPPEQTRAAAQRGSELASNDLERAISKAQNLYLDQRYREAARLLEAQLPKHPRDLDLLYLLAESLFHDGQITEALEMFDRALEVSPTFRVAASHPASAALARGDRSAYRRYARGVRGLGPVEARVAYLAGDDDAAVALEYSPWKIDLVHRRFEKADEEWSKRDVGPDKLAYFMARAVLAGDPAAARDHFDAMWPEVKKRASVPSVAFALQRLARVLIIGGFGRELRELRTAWEASKTPVNLIAHKEIAVFAAAMLDHATPPASELTTRLARAAEAIEAERAGDLAKATGILVELVRVPEGRGTDYLIRHAYARVLAARADKETLAGRCNEWQRPGLYEHAALALRGYCDVVLRALERAP